MKKARAVLVAVSAVVLVVCLLATYLTRGVMVHLPFLVARNSGAPTGLVDQRPWQTIAALAPLAVSAEEQEYAHEAERLADHEVDQAFATALRQTAMETRVLTGDALALQQKIAAIALVVKDDQARVDSLTAQIAAMAKSGNPAVASRSDDLDVAKAQLQLDTDELNDATQDLARETGDKRTRIQQELTARQAAMRKYDDQMGSGGQIAVLSAKRYVTLAHRIGAWFDQRTRKALIEQAKAEADSDSLALSAQHEALDKKSEAMAATMTAMTTVGPQTLAAGNTSKAKVAQMGHMHSMAEIHSSLDDRLQTEQQLSAVYTKWGAQVDLQHHIVTHLILQSFAWIAALILGGVLTWWVIQTLLDRSSIDPRSLHTLRTITDLGIELIALALVLLVVFGVPEQVPTILGLATAGLTVVFQDFILAFFGWFVLMGRNGIRVGDWVEINGVGGEVLEIGVFRTTLLETGNWTDKGPPTGRRARFINNYAISGQFFNFSTTGQWMWDEISVNLPGGIDTFKMIEAIHAAVVEQTSSDAKLAEKEWKSANRQQGLARFSAAPSVDMRPAVWGIDILVRYVTRAGDRFEMRNRLYETVISLLHNQSAQG